ncbi:MAG: family 16 glycoside hydrolase [Candidatus Cyclobacteriaceae bacterium M3_2C_046]
MKKIKFQMSSLIVLCFVWSCSSNSSSIQEQNETVLLTDQEKSEGWEMLFDGATANGWRGFKKDGFPARGWKIKDGMLISTGESGGDIITEQQYENFDLSLEWKIEAEGNSGVVFHVVESDQYKGSWNTAPEVQIIDDEGYPGNLKNVQKTGANYDLHEPADLAANPPGAWNQFRIIVNQGHVTHFLNGQKVVEYQLGSPDWKARVEKSKFKQYPDYGYNKKGHIGLQDHGHTVYFRNIKIRKPAYQHPFALQLYSLRNQMNQDPEKTLQMVADMGFTEVETAGFHGMTAEAYSKKLKELGLKCSGMHVGYEKLKNNMPQVIQEAKLFGAKYIVCPWLPHDETPTLENINQWASDLNIFGQQLQQEQLIMVYHNHGYEFQPYQQGTLFDVLMEKTNPEQVKYQMDVFWTIHPGQDPIKLMKQYPGRFISLHLKDMAKGTETGNLTGHAPEEAIALFGEGMIDLQGILKEARLQGIKHYYMEDESPQVENNLPLNINYLNDVIL